MNNKKYIMCIGCGAVQVRTDIQEAIGSSYVTLKKFHRPCKNCEGKQHIATQNTKSLKVSLDQKPEERKTNLDRKVLRLLKKEQL